MCCSALVKRDLDYLGWHYEAIQVRTDYEVYQRDHKVDPKQFSPFEDRIYPGHLAPVIYEKDGQRLVSPMRCSANLISSFWSGAFMRHHGFAVLDAFYEWVAVSGLLKAGVVTLDHVKAEFAKQAEQRKEKVLAAGKKYKLTPTELKDLWFRQIIIEFKPQDAQDLLVPAIFSYTKLADDRWDAGFAITTDDLPPEISIAGHDRCPVVLSPEGIEQWLRPEGKSAKEMEQVLIYQRRATFTHKLAEAA